ncbi:hypothetical protein [Streptomyces ipomoeae]|uniref:Uncharacterized protein n=1 Tax=Streptomyces ipomoeae 91-03 TaxID=698759 RepID=L1KY90_9ACTN|nr:hypothetical protein [Streptomyces ipomoeae]EKX65602.1 hypothetical protein STRIP9103_09663 [Streptomyces ipomoeae 91-03]MDX2845900.1 hypothetical protein [Streptomyces ipomoeae]
MTPYHAVEITLTRPASLGELRHARRRVPLDANADRTRMMVVHSAPSPGGALHLLRRRLGTRLPIGLLTTHYPSRRGKVLLNIALSHAADRALHRDAAVVGQRPQDVLSQRVTAALAQNAQERVRHLEDRLESLLARHAPEEVLACVTSSVLSRQHRRAPTAR